MKLAMAAAPLAALRLAALIALAAHRLGHATAGSQLSVSAVEKVVQMLEDMATESKQERQDEEAAFAKLRTWCAAETAQLAAQTARAAEDLEKLGTSIGKLESDAKVLGEGIAGLHAKVEGLEAKKKAAAEQRKRDHEAFLAESGDFAESADALERAVEVLQLQDYDRTGSETALMEVSTNGRIPAKARFIMSQYLIMLGSGGSEGNPADPLAFEEPEAKAYEFQSGSIIEMLQRLKEDFRLKLDESRKEEMNSKHANDMIMLDLTDSIGNRQREIQEKTVEKERRAEKASLDKRQLTVVTAVQAENRDVLEATKTECDEKSLSFQEKQKLRGEELEAIAKAVEILRSQDVSGAAQKHLGAVQLPPPATALAQFTSGRGQWRVLDFLASEGRRLHSSKLSLLAEKLAADPFVKVKTLIGDMIARLQEEANSDRDHEGFCDTELGKSKMTRSKLSEGVDGLNAAIQAGKSEVLALAESTQRLQGEVQELMEAQGRAAELRSQEHVRNKLAVVDAKKAQEAVAAAKAVLEDFYAKAPTATALAQVPSARGRGPKQRVRMGSDEWNALADPDAGAPDTGHREGMQTFGEAYRGQQDKAKAGVLTLLEIIQSDFASLEADTKSAEAEGRRAFESFSAEAKKSRSVKEKRIEMNNADRTAAEEKLQEDSSELKSMERELAAAERYHAQLVPQCVDQGMSFEERTGAWATEVASLKRALELLA